MQALENQAIKSLFDNIATHYDQHAWVINEIAQRLLMRLDMISLQPNAILDMGCGTGYCTTCLAKRYPEAETTAVDLSTTMLNQITKQQGLHFISGCLSEVKGKFDLIVANLVMPWADADKVFHSAKQLLSSDGIFLFSNLGPNTFKEISNVKFDDMHDLGDKLLQVGFKDPVMDMQQITVEYKQSLQKELLNTGLAAFIDAPEDFVGEVTYEIIFGLAHGREANLASQQPQESYIPIESIKRK